MTDYRMYPAKITNIETLTPLIKRFTFARSDGQHFPAFTGGSHIIVSMQDKDKSYHNAYSLMSNANDLSHYQICVRMDEVGRGGSLFLHNNVTVGSDIEISEPKNLFELAKDGSKHILIAGGIGITPFLPQLNELKQRNVPYELHYAFRAKEHGALVPELSSGEHSQYCSYYIDSENSQLDLDKLIGSQPTDTHFYVCGPKPLIDAVIATCQRKGIADKYIHWEKFSVDIPTDSQEFTIVLAKSGIEATVPVDKTILQVIEDNKIEVECLCREGVCGTCETRILEGEAEHLDQYLSDDEKASQQTMMVCVSRAKSKRLVLDL